MKSVWAKTLCRLLMVLMVWSPVQFAQAGMIGTEQVAAAASQADRNTVLQYLGRAEVTSQLQTMGVDAATVRDRVAAMTDQEVQSLAGKIQSMPAGADDAGIIILILVVAAVVWWVWFRR
jgi:uncharacterized protein DUF6627